MKDRSPILLLSALCLFHLMPPHHTATGGTKQWSHCAAGYYVTCRGPQHALMALHNSNFTPRISQCKINSIDVALSVAELRRAWSVCSLPADSPVVSSRPLPSHYTPVYACGHVGAYEPWPSPPVASMARYRKRSYRVANARHRLNFRSVGWAGGLFSQSVVSSASTFRRVDPVCEAWLNWYRQHDAAVLSATACESRLVSASIRTSRYGGTVTDKGPG